MKRIHVLFCLMAVFVATIGGCTDDEETLGSIYGTVTDYATGEPIGNVNVKLRPSGETTLTGNDGSYEFTGLDAGKYSLMLSKAEYNDLDDDYIIEVEKGKQVRRDVQMLRQIASLQITDMAGNDISELAFGAEESVTTKSFNIFNSGSLNITCEANYSCVWITSLTDIANPITPGQTVTVTVTIDRTRLSAGENSTYIHIVSNNGSNELKVTATGNDVPTVVTASVTGITSSSAECGGNVTADGGSYVTDRGICWSTSNAPTTANSTMPMGQGTGSYTCTMSGLELGTTYYVRAYATNSRGTAYGEQKTFTTADGLPTVTINEVSGITSTAAVCGGNVTANGGYAVTAKGLVWSTNQYPTLNDNSANLGSGNGTFTGSMTGLALATTYYVRAYATNSQGTAYSQQRQFTTGDGKPTVTTTAVTESNGTIQSGGNVTDDGGQPVTARGICYGPYPDLSAAYTHTNNGTGTGYYTSLIDTNFTGTIYVRAYATNANGTSYGNELVVNREYLALPTFTYNGHTYKVAPDPHNSNSLYMSWTAAYTYCENLTAYGYSDWRMPTIGELEAMFANRNTIGGFIYDGYRSYSYYHSSTAISNDTNYHYQLNWQNGSRINNSALHDTGHYYYNYESHNAHVRPIRIDH